MTDVYLRMYEFFLNADGVASKENEKLFGDNCACKLWLHKYKFRWESGVFSFYLILLFVSHYTAQKVQHE